MSTTRDLALTPAGRGAPTRRRSLAVPGLVLVAVASVTGCGEQSPASSASGQGGVDSASDAAEAPGVARLVKGEARPELSCPTDGRKSIMADPAPDAEGAPTPEEALADQELRDGESVTVTANGSTAWVLRPDGTASEMMSLTQADGWFVTQRISCG